jgi:hypothetical protein
MEQLFELSVDTCMIVGMFVGKAIRRHYRATSSVAATKGLSLLPGS